MKNKKINICSHLTIGYKYYLPYLFLYLIFSLLSGLCINPFIGNKITITSDIIILLLALIPLLGICLYFFIFAYNLAFIHINEDYIYIRKFITQFKISLDEIEYIDDNWLSYPATIKISFYKRQKFGKCIRLMLPIHEVFAYKLNTKKRKIKSLDLLKEYWNNKRINNLAIHATGKDRGQK